MRNQEKEHDWSELPIDLKNYTLTQLKLFKLEASERIAKLIAAFIVASIVAILLLVGFVFASLSLALFLGEYLKNYGLGFALIGGSAIILALILKSLFAEKTKNKLRDLFILEILRKDD